MSEDAKWNGFSIILVIRSSVKIGKLSSSVQTFPILLANHEKAAKRGGVTACDFVTFGRFANRIFPSMIQQIPNNAGQDKHQQNRRFLVEHDQSTGQNDQPGTPIAPAAAHDRPAYRELDANDSQGDAAH